jgi:uncharacterized protein (TIGR00645 family)
MKRIERVIATIFFSSRWLIAPFLIGLIVGLAAMVYKFIAKLIDFVSQLATMPPSDVIVGILTLVDLTLTANLIVMVICSSCENFVMPIDPADHPRWPASLVKVGFSDLKQKLLGSIVAIAAVNVLEWFMDIDEHADSTKLAWVVGIMLAFAVALLILAVADRVNNKSNDAAH